MLGMLFADPWMSNAWLAPATAGDTIRDITGAALAVNDTVKLLGTITAINPVAGHFDDLTITLTYPSGSALPSAGQVIKAHPLQVVKV